MFKILFWIFCIIFIFELIINLLYHFLFNKKERDELEKTFKLEIEQDKVNKDNVNNDKDKYNKNSEYILKS